MLTTTGIYRDRIMAAFVGSLFLLPIGSGCEQKEKVLDIETPGTDIEVERSTDTGEVDVDGDEP